MVYKDCMAYVRDPELIERFNQLKNEPIINAHEFTFVMLYTLMMVIFGNGGRSEIAYKQLLEVK